MKRIHTDRVTQLFIVKNLLLWGLISIYYDIRLQNGGLFFIEEICCLLIVLNVIDRGNTIIFTRKKK